MVRVKRPDVPLTDDRRDLVDRYRPLAWSIVHKVKAFHRAARLFPLADLAAWAEDGLMEAAGSYQTDRGVDFSTYARHRIRGAILDGIGDGVRHHHRAAPVGNPDWLDHQPDRRRKGFAAPGGSVLTIHPDGTPPEDRLSGKAWTRRKARELVRQFMPGGHADGGRKFSRQQITLYAVMVRPDGWTERDARNCLARFWGVPEARTVTYLWAAREAIRRTIGDPDIRESICA